MDDKNLSDLISSPLATAKDADDDQSESVHSDKESGSHSSAKASQRGSVIILTDRTPSGTSTFSTKRAVLRSHGIDVDILDRLDGTHIRQWLSKRYRVVDCEGGPRFLGSLLTSRAINEVILTIHPGVQAGNAPRIAYETSAGTDKAAKKVAGTPTDGELLAIGYDQDGAVFLRYSLCNTHT